MAVAVTFCTTTWSLRQVSGSVSFSVISFMPVSFAGGRGHGEGEGHGGCPWACTEHSHQGLRRAPSPVLGRGYFPLGPCPPLGRLSASPRPTPGSVHTADQRPTWCFPTVRHLGYQPLGSGQWFWRPVSSQRFPPSGPHIFWSFLVGPPTQVQLSPSSWRLTRCR